jgi:hypothetical protein
MLLVRPGFSLQSFEKERFPALHSGLSFFSKGFPLQSLTRNFFCLETKEAKIQGQIFLVLIFTTALRPPQSKPRA